MPQPERVNPLPARTSTSLFDLDVLVGRLEGLVGPLAAPTISTVLEPLELLLADLAEAPLTSLGARLAGVEVLRLLVMRSELESSCDAAPFGGQVVVITGPPRSGSTFLHELFALDPTNAHLTLARALSVTATDEAAVAFATKFLTMADSLSPRLRQLHPMAPDAPEECITAMQPSFVSEKFLCTFDLPRYGEWFDASSLHETYHWYSRLLGSLFQGTGCIVLKAPAHLAHLDAMREAFPTARFVILSRDMDRVTDSFVELVAAARTVYSDDVHPAQIRREWGPRLAAAQAELPAWAEGDNDRVRHLRFDLLTDDPCWALASLYEWLGWVPSFGETSWSRRVGTLAARHRTTP